MPTISSDKVEIPGIKAILPSLAALSKAGVKPGLIANTAPASSAAFNCSGVVIVPAPTMASLTSWLISRIASKAIGVRKVISKTLMPPATKAFANGTASSMFLITITGITGPAFKTSVA